MFYQLHQHNLWPPDRGRDPQQASAWDQRDFGFGTQPLHHILPPVKISISIPPDCQIWSYLFSNCKLQSGVKTLETDGAWHKLANSMLLWYSFTISLPLILTFVLLGACLLSLNGFSEVFIHLMWKIPQYKIIYIILTPAFAGSAPEWGQSWSFPRGDREWSPAWTPAIIALQLEKIVKEHLQYCNNEEIVKRVCEWAGESIKGL